MTQTPRRQMPAGYKLRVDGHLDDHWSPWFGDLTLTHEDDGTTSLSGVVADQAALHGLLTKIRDLGVTLISVQMTHPSAKGSPLWMSGASTAGDQPVEAHPDRT